MYIKVYTKIKLLIIFYTWIYMRIAALDIGDVWTGVAVSDPLGITARPYTTVKYNELIAFLTQFIQQEQVDTIVVGHPCTLKGTASEQTKKVEKFFLELEERFPTISWALWDERMTSKQAAQIKKAKTKEEKLKQHAIAAALVLRTYLDHIAWKRNN